MPQGKPTNSIIVGNCIACQGLVRVPSTINAQSNVRCPHCQETFAISTLLDQSVPELEVVDSEQDSEPAKPSLYIDQHVGEVKDKSGKFVVPSQLAKGARRRGKSRRSRSRSSRERESRGKQEPSQRISNRQPSSQARSNDVAPPEFRPSSRRPVVRASERNPAIEFLKVMAGAALAIPIAYLVVMWGFGQDPFGVGRSVGKMAPFLIPENLRPEQNEDTDDRSPPATDPSQSFSDDPFSDLSNLGKGSLEGLSD